MLQKLRSLFAGLRLSFLRNQVGALTLAESATFSSDDLQRGIIETFVIESVVLDRLPLLPVSGNSYAYNQEATLPGVEFRAVNAAYSESTGAITRRSENLVILGGDADVDRFLVQTRGNLNDLRAFQERAKVKSLTYKFQDAFINGDVGVDANGFNGLKTRLTGAQVLTTATNGMNPITAGYDFFDAVDALLAAAPGADAIYMNAAALARIRSAARRIGGWNMTVDQFGRSIDTYNGVQMLDIGKRADGVEIIPNNEITGTSTNTTSLYAVKFGRDESDQGVSGLTNGGVSVRDLGELDTKPVFRTRIEFYCGLALFGGRAAARLKGVIAS